MPKGSRESVHELDLDVQVQQLVESIESTTRDITARSAEDFGEDPLMTPKAMAALANPEPAVAVAEETVAPDELDASSFESPEELDAAEETEPAEVFDSPDEIESAEIPEVQDEPIDSVEAVEGALDQIDEAVDRLVENAVDGVSAPKAAPAPEAVEAVETVAPADSIADADAVEAVENAGAAEIAEATDADEIAERATGAVEASVIETPAEVEATDYIEAAQQDESEDTESAEDAEAGADAEQPDEFAVEGYFDSVDEAGANIATASVPVDDDSTEEPDDPIDDFGEISAPAPAAVADARPAAELGSAKDDKSSPAEAVKADPAPPAAPVITGATKPSGGLKRIPALVAAMAGRLGPTAAKAVVFVNAPLLRLGPSARQIVGLLAINTAFLAVCVLIIVFLRTAL